MEQPLITVGITCFNEGQMLLECWESVVAQTDDRWVAVLVMDGTTHEETKRIFNELNHSKLVAKYAFAENVGHAGTHNKAVELTQTPYHFYLDGDDMLFPDAVASVLRCFAAHPDAGYVYGDRQYFGGEDHYQRQPDEYTLDDLTEGRHPGGPNAYRTETWKQLGGMSPEVTHGPADYDWYLGAFEAGVRGYRCDQVIYRYRSRDPRHVNMTAGWQPNCHRLWEIMVRRHSHLFADRKRRKRFLTRGYMRALHPNTLAGNHRLASRLALQCILSGEWRSHRLWSICLRGIIPAGIHAWLQDTWCKYCGRSR